MNSTILFVPGLRDHVADHWQTLLAADIPGCRTVPPLQDDKLSCAARVAALDLAIGAIAGPVILAAHSAGCLMVAHWARAHRRPIKAALLAVPPDVERPLPEGYPQMDALKANGWLPTPRTPLPFRSVVAASIDDPLADLDRVAGLALGWGSELEVVGAVGHLNPAAGFGPWPLALPLLEALDRDERAPLSRIVG